MSFIQSLSVSIVCTTSIASSAIQVFHTLSLTLRLTVYIQLFWYV